VGNYGNKTQGDLAAGVPGEDSSAGAVNVVYGTAGGLDSPGNQVFREGSGGIGDQSEPGDRFGNAVG